MSSIHPWNKRAVIAFLILIKASFAYTQCTAVQRSGSTFGIVALAGSQITFNNTGNLAASDGSMATSSALALITAGYTRYVKASNFGFNLPPTAVICGIEAAVEKRATGLLTTVTDRAVQLVKNGTIAGNNLANGASWPSAKTYFNYGGAWSDWGVTWMPADINANDFGIVVSANLSGLSVLPTAMIDHIRITVYYYEPPLLSFKNFTVTRNNNTAVLNWEGAAGRYDVQRSADNTNWETIATVPSTSFTDKHPLPGRSYYRIVSQHHQISVSRSLLLPDLVRVHCYPNPFSNQVILTGVPSGEQVLLTTLTGARVHCRYSYSGTIIKLDASGLAPGVYIVSAGSYHKMITKL